MTFNISQNISAAHGRGRTYTGVRNTLMAYALATGAYPSQSALASETGVDKGDVSRIKKLTDALDDTARAALVSLVTNFERADKGVASASQSDLTPLSDFSADHLTRKRTAPVKGEPKSLQDKVEGHMLEVLALIKKADTQADAEALAAFAADYIQQAVDTYGEVEEEDAA